MADAVKPLLLDLYCCAGGAAMGYHRAGFEVVGVDIVPRPRYPFTFVQADALEVLDNLSKFMPVRPDAIHSSPPCQKDNPLTKGTNAKTRAQHHTSLTAPTRDRLERLGIPYVIEQPAGSGEIREDLMLCMDMWPKKPPRVWRHRMFELSAGLVVQQLPHPKHSGRVRGWRHGVRYDGDYVAAYGNGGGKATVSEMQDALGITWTLVREELTEAIPPAYTEHIGAALLDHLEQEAERHEDRRTGGTFAHHFLGDRIDPIPATP